MMSVRCLRSVASLTIACSLSSRTSTRLGMSRRFLSSRVRWVSALRSCLPSLALAILKPRMVGRRCSALLVAAAPNSHSSLATSARAARISLSKARRSGLGMVRVGSSGFDLVVDERIEHELFSHVLDEVLLPPTLEHAIGNLDVTQVPSAGDHRRLMAAVAQARDLPQAQLAFEEAHGLIVQKIVNRASVEHGATADEAPLIDATAPALAVGQHIEAAVDHRGEQFRAPATAVEDNGDSSLADDLPHLSEQTGHSLRQSSIDLSGNHQQWVAGAVVDPIIGAGRHGQMSPRHVSI